MSPDIIFIWGRSLFCLKLELLEVNLIPHLSFASGGSIYESSCSAHQAGSGGGGSSAVGGGVVFSTTDHLLELDGAFRSDGRSAPSGTAGGGASGGTVWVASRHFEGHGSLTAMGGAGKTRSVLCNSQHNWWHAAYGGGGAGGYVRTYSPDPIRVDILEKRQVSGGVGSGGAGDRGQICTTGHQCSGHGSYRANDNTCACHATYYGVNCGFYCDPSVTCMSHGSCTGSGGCKCDRGYVGYHCEHRCDPAVDCNGNGRCSVTGRCVCDPCYDGAGCKLKCAGRGACVANACKCDSCYVGTYCHSECSGHGSCRNGTCDCDWRWRGQFCEIPGCPNDCCGNGICNGALHTCFCNPGWGEVDCCSTDCPGEPNCFGRGDCVTVGSTPVCKNCSKGWMGPACNDPCTHGVQTPMDSGVCKCDPCWAGKGCDALCMDRGTCRNGTCVCDPLLGWRGSVCEIPGCPGIGSDCSGHGDCNGAKHECTCFNGWTGVGCHIPDCPGAPNCFNRGYCDSTVDPPICQNCSRGWMGSACADPCKFGEQTPMDSGNCTCLPGYTGVGYDSECSEHGNVINGRCRCKDGWRGPVCNIPGCPGEEKDCSGHGTCNSATHICTCQLGWTGNGCEIPDCPGSPNCFNRGYCNATTDPPKCQNCSVGWMGPACKDPCTHGIQVPMDGGNCVCEAGYSGAGCNSECSEHGKIVGNGTCECHPGWWGAVCMIQGCPGVGTDCSGHGECNSATQTCVCENGWTGAGCSVPDCPGNPNCAGRGEALFLSKSRFFISAKTVSSLVNFTL